MPNLRLFRSSPPLPTTWRLLLISWTDWRMNTTSKQYFFRKNNLTPLPLASSVSIHAKFLLLANFLKSYSFFAVALKMCKKCYNKQKIFLARNPRIKNAEIYADFKFDGARSKNASIKSYSHFKFFYSY